MLTSLIVLLSLTGPFPQSSAQVQPAAGLPSPARPLAGHGSAFSYSNCRFGTVADGTEEFDVGASLNTGWYLGFWARESPPDPPGAEFVQHVRLSQDRGGSPNCGPDYGYEATPQLSEGGLGKIIDQNPGRLWIVGNEPDRQGQDGICPQQYAEAYHDVYHFIKGRDRTAQVAVAGLVVVSPGRLQYLDIIWDSYRARYGGPAMPVDVWTMHAYVLSEVGEGDAHIALGTEPALAIPYSNACADDASYCHAEHDKPSLFEAQVVAMREWMKDHDQQEKPLLITEHGILKPFNYYGTCPATTTTCEFGDVPGCFCDENDETFHPSRVADFLEAVFNYLLTASDPQLGFPADEYRLVQQWNWYSVATSPGNPQELAHASNLADPDSAYTLTAAGESWQTIAHAIAPAVNLFPSRVPVAVGYAGDETGSVTITLSVEVMNNGNTSVPGPVTATFYSDAEMTVPIGSATVTDLGGCARHTAVATTTWAGVAPGMHPFWVLVDSPGTLDETNEDDNSAQGYALSPRAVYYLPIASRRH